ncbi:hypothetical protein [Hymenobacter convexus]|uniref:hypothetical protein n=1 Tax=Hymenobacter sp. CA1UV-4 TaxID=3063782 RepID=UPI00271227C0|nr:hypothetical protein [Hymenobacter sp. CA1UV-4]MDO7851756.1 hypothetical protein [Hymenobacter sp. CA1UV-4]
MSTGWKYMRVILDGERHEINGLNIWEHNWQNTGQRITVQDPLYGQTYSMPIYEIEAGAICARFATTEFSNGIWGIYQEG